jgi:hypothetical protein
MKSSAIDPKARKLSSFYVGESESFTFDFGERES